MKNFFVMTTIVFLLSFGLAYAVSDREEGLEVKNWKGDYIGSIKHVLTDPSSGRIIFVVLSLGREQGREIAVPVKSFSSYNFEGGYFILNVSKEILKAAPEFQVSDLEDPSFVEKVYRFFATAPSWSDGTDRESGS